MTKMTTKMCVYSVLTDLISVQSLMLIKSSNMKHHYEIVLFIVMNEFICLV